MVLQLSGCTFLAPWSSSLTETGGAAWDEEISWQIPGAWMGSRFCHLTLGENTCQRLFFAANSWTLSRPFWLTELHAEGRGMGR